MLSKAIELLLKGVAWRGEWYKKLAAGPVELYSALRTLAEGNSCTRGVVSFRDTTKANVQVV